MKLLPGAAIGAGKIHFEREKKDRLVLVNDSDFEVRYRQRKVAGGRKERIPLLSTVKIFVENADCGLVIK